MRLITQTSALALLVCLLPLAPTQAALTIGFFNNGTSSTLDVNVGDTFELPIYLLESTPDTILSTSGLISMGVKATFSAARLEVTGINLNPDFNLPQPTNFGTPGEFDFNAGTVFAVTGSTIWLGTVTMRSKAAGAADVDVGHTFSGFDEFVAADGSGTVLDTQIFGSGLTGQYTATITGLNAIPEPSSGAMVMLAAVCSGLGMRRRTELNAVAGC